MNEEIEEFAFKDRKTLANLNEIDLLEIIEFLQLDRKQWINQYTKAHNDYVELQQENHQLKEELEKQFKSMSAIIHHNSDLYLEESNKLIKERQQLKDRNEKTIELIENVYNSLENVDRPIMFYEEILKMLKGEENE